MTLEGRILNREDAEILQIQEGSPALTVTRTTCLADGRPFEYMKWVGRADMVSFSTEFGASGSFYPGLLDIWGSEGCDGSKESPVSSPAR